MKYIRTEDGHIYEYVEQRIYLGQYLKFGLYRHNLKSEYEVIIAQADTIEELCDEAVAVYPDGTHDNCSVMHIVDNNGFREAVYGCLSVSVDDIKKDYECWEIYGAIWTDKGLIYVAKMDDDGKLVLI